MEIYCTVCTELHYIWEEIDAFSMGQATPISITKSLKQCGFTHVAAVTPVLS